MNKILRHPNTINIIFFILFCASPIVYGLVYVLPFLYLRCGYVGLFFMVTISFITGIMFKEGLLPLLTIFGLFHICGSIIMYIYWLSTGQFYHFCIPGCIMAFLVFLRMIMASFENRYEREKIELKKLNVL